MQPILFLPFLWNFTSKNAAKKIDSDMFEQEKLRCLAKNKKFKYLSWGFNGSIMINPFEVNKNHQTSQISEHRCSYHMSYQHLASGKQTNSY
jgi:hypothetical protein